MPLIESAVVGAAAVKRVKRGAKAAATAVTQGAQAPEALAVGLEAATGIPATATHGLAVKATTAGMKAAETVASTVAEKTPEVLDAAKERVGAAVEGARSLGHRALSVQFRRKKPEIEGPPEAPSS